MPGIDLAQFDRWFDAYAARLKVYARQWVHADQADDLVQDAFVQLLAQRRPPNNVAAWLFTVVRRAAVTGRRSRTRRQQREHRVAEDQAAWFEPDLAAPIDAAHAQTALAALDAHRREVVVLRIWGGLPFAEIAAITATPLSTVYDQYRSGLTDMRHFMENTCPSTTRT
jgi:RNA polymerase sigma-70 factor (ECF subfamily)